MPAALPQDYKTVIRENYDSLIDFIVDTPFSQVIDELYELPIEKRPEFVRNVVLNSAALLQRGITVPDGILIERSTFGDGRPTLFVVKRYLPAAYRMAWENVNFTFDIEHKGSDVLSGAEAWRKPVPVEVQAALFALGITKLGLNELDRRDV